jgi:hypothetical protein
MATKGLADKLTDPKSFGPGLWLHIHSKARRAITQRKMTDFAEDMKTIAEDIKCGDCRSHAMKYIQENPIEPYFPMVDPEENNTPIGCFRWTWQFHNTVSARIRLKIVDWETAKALFPLPLNNPHSDPIGICEADCGKEKEQNKKPDPIHFRVIGWSPAGSRPVGQARR